MTIPQHSLENQKNYKKHHTSSWKNMHTDWRMWVGLVIIVVALSIYVMSVDFSIQPATTTNTVTH